MARKGKFDLGDLVHAGMIREGEPIFFVSDPSKSVVVARQPNGDYKILSEGDPLSIHGAAQKFLGQEPPNHASHWFRNDSGQTLYQLWQNQLEE